MKLIFTRKEKWLKGLFCIFALGFVLRLSGLGYGLPYLSHPDEARIVLDTLSMGHRMSLLPVMPDYALLYRYILLFLYGAFYAIGRLLHWFSGSLDFALKFFLDFAPIYLISRSLSAILGTCLAIPAYYLGSRIFASRQTGIIAACFVLFEFQLLQHSQWALYSIIFCFVSLPAFFYILSLMSQPKLKNFALAGACCGLAISTQNQGVFLLPGLFTAYFFVLFKEWRAAHRNKVIRYTLFSIFILSLCSLIGNFYWIFIFGKSWARMLWIMDLTRVGFASSPPYANNFFDMAGWFMRELVRQDMLLGIILVCGLIYSFIRHRKEDLIFLLFVASNLLVTSKWGFRSLHDVISLVPITCVFGARFLSEITSGIKNKKLVYAVAAIAVVPLVFQASAIDLKKMRKDTRIEAKEWIEANIPSGKRLGMDWSVLSVPVQSDTPFLLRNPPGKKYYEEQLKPILGVRYNDYLLLKPHYGIEELMYWSAQPLWPAQMPQQVKDAAAKMPVYRDLYSRFIFKDFDTIVNKEKVDYLVLSSYVWSMFLLDQDPYKRHLFMPFIKDDPRRNFHHSASYVDDGRHGYLFFLAQQGRDFYARFLNDLPRGVRLLKVFTPNQGNLGPEIRIYQIIQNGN